MTTFEVTTAATLVADPPPDAVRSDVGRRALLRDLARLDLVLRAPVTAVRRSALIDHAQFLLDQLTTDHGVQDQLIWPAAVADRPGLTDLAERVRRSHHSIVEPVARLRTTAARWAAAPDTRAAVRSAVQQLTVTLGPVFEVDAEMLPVGCAAIPAAGWAELERRMPRQGGPTRTARRLFWQLDDLDPARAALLLRGRRPAELWVLRNGFSGAYNRGSYLMWSGGGAGPAV